MNPEFKETQKFTQWWLWLIVISTLAMPVISLFRALFLQEPNEESMSTASIIGIILGVSSVVFMFAAINLTTRINQNEIHFKLIPFVNKTYSWSDVKTAEVVNYGFVGGWGVRLWTKYGTVYNIKGNQGLAIELKNGKKFLIGSQKAAELKQFIEKAPIQE